LRVVAVGWGYNKPAALAELQPDALVNTPQELTNFFRLGRKSKSGG
jgi:hypothetical protein